MADSKGDKIQLVAMSDAEKKGLTEELVKTTRFTKREVEVFLKHGSRVPKQAFCELCDDSGFTTGDEQDMLWRIFDHDADGSISVKELVETLSKLTRGTLEDLTGVFFTLYDLNGDAGLDADEVIQVYESLLKHAHEGGGSGKLNAAQKDRIREFVRRADTSGDGQLDAQEFAAAVKALADGDMAGGGGQNNNKPGAPRGGLRSFCTLRNIWLTFITSWFEIGTSFCLPAMGALSLRLQGANGRFQATEADIGALVGWYYAGSMIGPLFGGQLLNRIGPAKTIIVANVLVTIGSLLQALADGKGQLWLLIVARIIIGFGGLITPFCTIEVLERLFPDHFMFMAGFRNLIQSGSGFLSFVLLPAIADHFAETEWMAGQAPDAYTVNVTTNATTGATALVNGTGVVNPAYNAGTGWALWFCFACSCVSLLSNLLVWILHMRDDSGKTPSAAAAAGKAALPVAAKIRALAGAIRPKAPGKCQDWKLPLSFYLSTFGIQAQYFAPFAFTAFSVQIYVQKFGMTEAEASFLSGFMNLLGGLLGPIAGPASDWLGWRAASLSAFGIFTIVGFALLAVTDVTPWVATVLFALTYGFGDTVAYPNIRLLCGAHRAGIGYGIFGVMGGGFAVVVPMIGGYIFDADTSGTTVCWYFAGLAGLASLLWALVSCMEGRKSAIELPASKLIESSDEHIEAAALAGIAGDAGDNGAKV